MKIILIISIILITYSLFTAIYPNLSHKMSYEELPSNYTNTQISYNTSEINSYSKSQLKDMVQDLFTTNIYIYIEKDLPSGKLGLSNVFARLLIVEADLSNYNYILTLTHETIHINHMTLNERYVSYMTFIKLYESGIDIFKQVALCYANSQINGEYPYDYNCGSQIFEYMQECST